MQSLIISRDVEIADSVLNNLQTNWVVYNTDMQIVAQQTLTGAPTKSVQEVLHTLPSAVYILQGTDIFGNTISRRVYVRP